ncbi:HAD-superfamily hydrolase, subfamily IA, variant 1 family protein [Candidatus Rhodobacter oscarellae]|uniref:phosphoglycolate phosphatase n=1 Tax=Candidatus Rhodobacter oscarellae TaxID=1675527 RepID=A0A0J9E6E8_9RHOB|nr:HAD family hydrolase [Candidatus Rhodobacter lobularis]KMW58241.1 HAD-superfamily hydrolase, subfamily IA, variant 1 family protein [Candidatus Rhodobacter lobularis]
MADAIKGVLFDKDGTLFDFNGTWNAWAKATLVALAQGDAPRAAELGRLIGYDFAAGAFDPASEVIAGTPDDIARLLAPGLPGRAMWEIEAELNAKAAQAPQVEAVPLGPLLEELRGMGLKLGVATNDAEAPARAHLASVGHEAGFDFIAGYDSGHGGKPAPGMCLAFASQMRLPAGQVVMVGDSTHDLLAGRAAGMRSVAVLTGMAGAEELAPHASAVLPDIGHLPDWIRAQG